MCQKPARKQGLACVGLPSLTVGLLKRCVLRPLERFRLVIDAFGCGRKVEGCDCFQIPGPLGSAEESIDSCQAYAGGEHHPCAIHNHAKAVGYDDMIKEFRGFAKPLLPEPGI